MACGGASGQQLLLPPLGVDAQEQGQNEYNHQFLASVIDYSPHSESSGASQIQQLLAAEMAKNLLNFLGAR